jgi:hypothetical protein
MWPEWVNTLGLVLNMAGVVLAFIYGFPQPSHEEGVGLGLEDATPMPDGRTVAQHNKDTRKQKARYLFWSRAGLGLMFAGFVLQLVATWIARLG